MGRSIDYIHLGEDEMISLNADYLKPVIDHAEKTQIVDEDVPPVQSVFDLKSGARAKLVDRSGSMVIVEVEKIPLRLDRMERGQGKDRGKVTPK